MNIENDNGLLIQEVNGQKHALGYLFDFGEGRGIFSPDGKIEITKEQADAHNKLLDEGLLLGLEKCGIGQYGTFYLKTEQGSKWVTTWMGTRVALADLNGNTVTFFYKNMKFRGRLQKDADCFNFKRVT